MKTKEYIGVQEQVDFVNMVCDTMQVEGEYLPALFELAFRTAALHFFTDVKLGKAKHIQAEEANKVVFATRSFDELAEKCPPQLEALRTACKERLQIEQARTLALLAAKSGPDPFERIAGLLEGFVGQLGNVSGEDIEKLSSMVETVQAFSKQLAPAE